MFPMVSIILPAYNRENLILETLNSVTAQTYQTWECLVIDDGSTDRTAEIVKDFARKDPRILYHLRPDLYPKGACGARNYGLSLSKGEYIQWLDDDDLLGPNKLELQVMALENSDKNLVATCAWDLFWHGKTLELNDILDGIEFTDCEGFFSKMTKTRSFIPPLAYLTPKKIAIEAGEWNTKLRINQDAEYFTRVILASNKIINVKNCYVLYRSHEAKRISSEKNSERLYSLIYSLRLMHAHLKAKKIESKSYFNMKLQRVFFGFWHSDKEVLEKHSFFFKEHDINLKLSRYYMLRYYIYKKIYPLYKKYLK